MWIVDPNGNPKNFDLAPGKSATYWYSWHGNWMGFHSATPLIFYTAGPLFTTAQALWYDGPEVKNGVTIKNTGSGTTSFNIYVY